MKHIPQLFAALMWSLVATLFVWHGPWGETRMWFWNDGKAEVRYGPPGATPSPYPPIVHPRIESVRPTSTPRPLPL